MKVTLFLIFTIFSTSLGFANYLADTTIVEFTDKQINKKITVHTSGDKEIELPLSLDLNSILINLGIDSNDREKTLVLISSGSGKKDTILLINRDGQRIKIIARDMFKKANSDSLKTTNEADLNAWNQNTQGSFEKKEPEKPAIEKPKRFFSKSDFGFYLGLNNWTNSSLPNSQNYNLRTWKSRFVALSFRKNVTLLFGEKSDLAFSYGPEISWNNFMFENSNIPFVVNNQLTVKNASYITQKSKLVIPSVNFPVLFNIGLQESKMKLGVGAYAGYRLGSYTKTKDLDNNKFKTKDDFGLNNFIYGLTGELGRKNGLTIFIRYNLNDVFKSDQINTTGIQAFSFGLRI